MEAYIENHIKWSCDKHDAIMIHNRLGDNKTTLIKSSSGKEIWRHLVESSSAADPVSLDDLQSKLQVLFAGAVSPSVLRQDIEQFLCKLSSEQIIRIEHKPIDLSDSHEK